MATTFETIGGPCAGTPVVVEGGEPPETLRLRNWKDKGDMGVYLYRYRESDCTYHYDCPVEEEDAISLTRGEIAES